MNTAEADQAFELLTPSEDLMIELLIARHRLGEVVWNISNKNLKTARKLQSKGFLDFKAGNVEGYFIAWLTDTAKEAWMSSPYTPPILAG